MMTSTLSLADWASVATIITAVSAVLAVVFAIWQTRQNRHHQLEALAREQYQNFLEMCVKHPEFAPPDPTKLDINSCLLDGDASKFNRYEWFFTAGSNALEAIFKTVDDTVWRETIVNVLGDHRAYLTSKRYDDVHRITVDPDFQKFLDANFPKPIAILATAVAAE